jgi:hypothetical protein
MRLARAGLPYPLRRRSVLLGAVAALAGCKPQQAKESAPMTMKDIHAGYASTPADWLAFLRCWRETVQARLAKRPGYSGLAALPPGVNRVADAPGDVSAEAARLQQQLKVQLPRSYLDFAQARHGQGWVIESLTEAGVIGEATADVLPLASIGRFADLDAATLDTWLKNGAAGRAIRPDEYYRYGYQADVSRVQDGALFHVEALKPMIKVGDFAQGGVLLLNPHEATADGEMEAWALDFRTFASRFRSFAELMQDLAYLDSDPDRAESPLTVPQAYDRCPCVKLLRTAATT